MSGSAQNLDERREPIVAVPGLDATTDQIVHQSRKLGTRAEAVEGPQRSVERRGIGRHGGRPVMSALRPTADLGARSSVQPHLSLSHRSDRTSKTNQASQLDRTVASRRSDRHRLVSSRTDDPAHHFLHHLRDLRTTVGVRGRDGGGSA